MVQSGRYADFRQLLSREAPTDQATVAMTLRLPDEARDRYPAVVIVHTIAGYQEANEGWHADQFRKAGFATLTYESPTARSMLQGASGSRGAPWASAVAEAYSALRAAGRRSENRRQPDRHRRLLVWWRGGPPCRLRTTARRARAGTSPVCRPRLLLSGGRLWRRCRAGGLYGRADPDAVGREGRQPAGRKGRGVSCLRQKRGFRAADRGLDLSGRVSRLDGSKPGRRALLSAISQHAKVSVPSAGASGRLSSSAAAKRRWIPMSCRPV